MNRRTACRRHSRRGFVLPMLGVFLIGLFAFVALAVDIGMITVARTECQNAADVAALAGCRNLNNKPGSTDSNRSAALATASSAITTNKLMNESFTSAQVKSTVTGVYKYDTSTQTFGYKAEAPATGLSYTAMRVEVAVQQPTFFARVLGFNTMPTGAVATAVYRPRDVAFVLDMTGSMAYSSTFNSGSWSGYSGSMDPNDLVPNFGHYVSMQSSLIASQDRTDGDGQAYSRSNITITTPSGPPIIRNFYFDPVNLGSPATPAVPVTLITDNSDPANPVQRPESNAFHRSNVTESPGTPSTYTPQTYSFASYNPFANTRTEGATPAPDFYGDQIDSGSVLYAGDRWRRLDGKIYKTATSWSSSTTRAAGTAAELLGYKANPPTNGVNPAFATTWLNFRDPVWEQYGYDLKIDQYRTLRDGSANSSNPKGPLNPSSIPSSMVYASTDADSFKGYSMGPGYWGKTFFIWPPDPRPTKDWRKLYFRASTSADFATTPTATSVNGVLFRTATNSHTLNSTAVVDYPAILAWIKTGPQTLPPNLRAGRVVYYTSIPTDVNTASGTTEQRLDKAFWKNYIDWVLANGSDTSSAYLYGLGASWSSAPTNISTTALTTYNKFSWETTTQAGARYPYMRYTDSVQRPKLHFWFGPLSMIDFIGRAGGTGDNWKPGTCYEAQNWQLKTAMNSVISDIRNNHPNDNVGLAMFSHTNYSDIRMPMTQNYTALKNALFYPKDLLPAINGGDTTTEFRPFNTSFGGYSNDQIPNADGSTDPNTGLAMAFNLLSPSANLGTQYSAYNSPKGRRGASKLVIFETDGVPNAYRNVTLNKKGYDTYYTIGTAPAAGANGNSTALSQALSIVTQMSKTMSTNNNSNTDSGLSLPNAPCKVYSIAFGDLFDADLAPNADFRPTALQFLANVQVQGGTSSTGATTIPSTQIITGQYQTRIDTMKTCMERIFSSGVTVSLIE